MKESVISVLKINSRYLQSHRLKSLIARSVALTQQKQNLMLVLKNKHLTGMADEQECLTTTALLSEKYNPPKNCNLCFNVLLCLLPS